MVNKYLGYDEKKYDMRHEEQKAAAKKIIMRIAFWLISVPCVIFAAIFLCKISLDKTAVPNTSMEPTLEYGDHIIIDTLSYRFSSPDRFDVIVILRKQADHEIYDVKRIYGLPGETVCIKDGKILVNDKEIKEQVKVDDMELAGVASEPITLNDNEYFVLADNRNDAEDSRYTGYGLVKEENIIGRAWIRTDSFGFINLFNKK